MRKNAIDASRRNNACATKGEEEGKRSNERGKQREEKDKRSLSGSVTYDSSWRFSFFQPQTLRSQNAMLTSCCITLTIHG